MRVLVLAAALLASPAAAQPAKVVSEGPALQMGAQQLIVHSERVGRDFLIEVTPPASPKLYPGQTFPAIYALDGGYGFAGAEARLLGATGAMASAYVVAVGYPPQLWGKRMTDLSFRPTRFQGQDVASGGEAFAAFLIEELRPLIETRYAADPKRAVLFGHSAGGLFTANVLAARPEAFAGYVIASPSVHLDPGVVHCVAAAAPRGIGQRVFVAAGGREEASMRSGADRIAAALGRRFAVARRDFPGANHLSYYPAVMAEGFAYVLPSVRARDAPAHAILSADAAAPYLGAWRLEDGRRLTISLQDGWLYADLDGVGRSPLESEGPGRFYLQGPDAEMTFAAAVVTIRMPGAILKGARLAP